MTIRWIDPFETYTSAQVTRYYNLTGSSAPTISTNAITGSRVISLSSYVFCWGISNLPNDPIGIFGFHLYAPSNASECVILNLLGPGSVLIGLLTITPNTGVLTYYRKDTSSAPVKLGSSAAGAVPANTWFHMGVKVKIGNANGSVLVKINGTDVALNLTNVNTQSNYAAIGPNISGFVFGYAGTNVSSNQSTYTSTLNGYLDNLYVADGAGPAPGNDLLGEVKVEVLRPNGAGSTAGMTPSAGANYTCVNEEQANDDTNYVSSATVGAKDSYALSDLSSTPAAIYAVAPFAIAKKDDAGTRGIKVSMKSGATSVTTADQSLGITYQAFSGMYELNPNGSIAWTAAAVNALEVGQEVT